jgi:nicotinate-nucleotide adenylyltransferase
MTLGPRVGILGGTFDPVHVGHVATARASCHALDLDRVLMVPSGTPPHRQQPGVSRYHRFAMTALAVTGLDRLQVSDLEIGEEDASYTYDTLLRLHARGLPALQIFFITGADAFAEIATWSRYPRVLDMANFVVVSRPGHPVSALRAVLPSLAARMLDVERQSTNASEPRIHLLDAPTPDVSSTDIRRRLADGGSISGMVPESVCVYIGQHGLYTPADANVTGKSLA